MKNTDDGTVKLSTKWFQRVVGYRISRINTPDLLLFSQSVLYLNNATVWY